jgi:hypothetical protein
MQLAALRAEAGTLALSAAPLRVPDQSNAALLYQEAFEGMVPHTKLSPVVQKKYELWFLADTTAALDVDDPDLVKFLAQQQSALALLRRASARPDCWFQRDYSRGLGTLVPELQSLRQGTNLLALEAHCLAAHGDLASALTNVAAIRRMARHTSGDPLLIGFLVSAAIEGRALQTLEQVLTAGTPTAEQLAPLKEVEPVGYRNVLRRSLLMEQAFGLTLSVAAAEGDRSFLEALGESDGLDLGLIAPVWRVFFLADEVGAYREVMYRCQALLSNSYPDRPGAWDQLEHDIKAEPLGILTRMLTPALTRTAAAATRTDASQRLIHLGVGIAEYRAVEGKYPARLADLFPRFVSYLPNDPYTGEPFKLVATEEGVVVYSVGPNLQDDGGQKIDYKPRPPTGDLTLRIGKPAPRAPVAMPPAK